MCCVTITFLTVGFDSYSSFLSLPSGSGASDRDIFSSVSGTRVTILTYCANI